MNTKHKELSEAQIDRIVEMAWEDRTPFDAILAQFDLRESDTIRLMRRELTPGSFRRWRARVQGRKTKHAVLRDRQVSRFRCSRQRNISGNRLSKR